MFQHLFATVLLLFFAFFSIVAEESTAGEKAKKTEVEGIRKLDEGKENGPKRITFTNNKFELHFSEDRVMKGTFKINTEENPSWMDMTILSDTEEKFKGKVALCIYKFDGEFFYWCAARPGRKRRPQEFVEIMGDARLILGKFKMEKK